MKTRRWDRWAIGCTLFGAASLSYLSTWPNWAMGDEQAARIQELHENVGELGRAEAALSTQTTRLSNARARQEAECRHVPDSADVADLMQALSLKVDGKVVHDQTFTVMDRPSQEGDRFEILPIQIEVEADFDSVWSILERIEQLPRLVRVSGLDVGLSDKALQSELADQSLIAVISLDVVYAPAGSLENNQ